MGSNTSKTSDDAAVHPQKNDLAIGSDSDPRSPTPEITRTPLQGKPGAKHNITKNVDLRKTFENSDGEKKLIHNNPILSAVIKNHLQSYDPRSPTQDFERTPIIIASKINELKNEKKITVPRNTANSGSPSLKVDDQDENYDSCAEAQESPDLLVPKNLCNGFFDMSLNEAIKEIDEPLGSSTASNETIETHMANQNTNEPKQLQETHFDYETEENEIEATTSYDNMELSLESDLQYIPIIQILKEDPRSPSSDIERTPIVVAISSDIESTSQGNVEDMSDDSLIKVLQSTNTELRHTASKASNEGLLIYEDETNILLDTPKKSKSDCSSGSRTPLSCMKNKTDTGHVRSKSANTLEDAKTQKLAKIARRVSHIPRLKSLSKPTTLIPTGSTISLKNISKKSAISGVVSGDCENTPPNSHRDKWDKDNSLVL